MKMKTSELTGAALDWAVAKCDGLEVDGDGPMWFGDHPHYNEIVRVLYAPSTNWSQGGPIIEREGIGLDYYEDGGHPDGGEWGAATNEGTVHAMGPTPLIAAMRCYVASKLGDDIEIPEELK